MTPFVAPPYDVIDPAEQVTLRERNPHNIVRLTLPEASPEGDPYQTAATLFQDWMEAGILYREARPAMYVWEQEFSHGGKTYRRRALVARVTCKPYQPGGVMRHEHTHAGPKKDRLNLFKATGAQFSQIFGIFDDENGAVSRQLTEVGEGALLQFAQGDDGHMSRLFGTSNAEIIGKLQAALKECTITMADGHHRYETSVAYYEELGCTGSTLMTLVPSSDPGLIVLPTHRTVGLPLDRPAFVRALEGSFSVETHEPGSWTRLYQEAVDHPDQGASVAVMPGSGQVIRIGWDREDMPESGPDTWPSFITDTVVLHEQILPRVSDPGRLKTEKFGYYHDAHEAVEAAQRDDRWCFLLRATSVEALLQVAEDQVVLPPKSTYFYPKFLAGFVNAYLD